MYSRTLPFLLISIAILSACHSRVQRKSDISAYERVFNAYLLNEHQATPVEEGYYLIIPAVHCASCVSSLLPAMQGVNLCPLTYISFKELDMNGICQGVGFLKDKGKLDTYNIPLHNIALIRYHGGHMRYVHSFVKFDKATLRSELDSLSTAPPTKK